MTLQPGRIYGGISQLGASAKAAAIPWYLTGGIAAANCIAAYQPKGAANLAASYINLTNPGTHNAAPGNAPTHDPATGWAFLAASSQYLITDIVPATGWSMIIQYSDVGNKDAALAGTFKNGAYFQLNPRGAVVYANGGVLTKSPEKLSGNLAVAGNKGYRDGVVESGVIPGWTAAASYPIWIGGTNDNNVLAGKITAKIQAIAIYNTILTALQVADLSAAMAAL